MNERPNPRVERSKRAVIASTAELLAERGVADITVDDIVERSGVAKTTIYRHWETKMDVLLDSVGTLARPPEAADTGTVDRDVRALLGDLVDHLRDRRTVARLAVLLEQAQRDRAFDVVRDRYVTGWQAAVSAALQRGIARGQLSQECDPDQLAEALLAPFFYRSLLAHGTAGEELRDRSADRCLRWAMDVDTPHEPVVQRVSRTLL